MEFICEAFDQMQRAFDLNGFNDHQLHCVLRFGSGAEALAWGILFMVMPLSGIFYPIHALPWLLRPVAIALPTTHAFAAGRALLAHQSLPWAQIGIAAAGTVGLLVVAVAFAVAMLSLFRKRGYITRYS